MSLTLTLPVSAQFLDGSSGLLQMPSPEMHQSGTFTITNVFLNKHTLNPTYWDYHSFGYSIGITFWQRLEINYTCVLVKGRSGWPEKTIGRFVNQDRHFSAKFLLIKEGEGGVEWLPSIAVGFSDPVTGGGGDYIGSDVSGQGSTMFLKNGFFNRYYVVLGKHFNSVAGALGVYAGYQYSRRLDFPMNNICLGVDWSPIWLQTEYLQTHCIAEFDSRTFNVGLLGGFWGNRVDVMLVLQSLRWPSFGVRYKLIL